MQCNACRLAVHKRCFNYVKFNCKSKENEEEGSGKNSLKHDFHVHNYSSPTFCDHCGSLLYGLLRQGLKCSICDANIHKNCTQFFGDRCGLNQTEKRGRLKLSFNFNLEKSILKVTIEQARNLVPMDPDGTSDPYVKIKIIGNESGTTIYSNGSNDSTNFNKFKTQIQKSTLNPDFNEVFEIVINQTMNFSRVLIEVWDYDLWNPNDFMGSMSFGISELRIRDISGWFQLLDKNEGEFYNLPILDFQDDVDEMIKTLGDMSCSESSKIGLKKLEQRRSELNLKTVINTDNRSGIKDFNFISVLGRGSFGKVLLAQHKITKKNYAIKCLKKDVIIKDDDLDCVFNEKRALSLKTANKPDFLVNLNCVFQTVDRIFFVMDFVSGGDLMFHIQKDNNFSEPRACFYAAEIILAIGFLHDNKIIYRDLKLDNVMIDEFGHIRLADFGMCKYLTTEPEVTKTFCGTPDYIAPEIIQRKYYSYSVDWWALGVLIYEMLVGMPPFDGLDEQELFDSILKQKVHFPRSVSRDASNFCRGLLEKDVEKRLGGNDKSKVTENRQKMKHHPFFKFTNWDKISKKEIQPCFQPKVKNTRDTSNFDNQFISEKMRLTPTDKMLVSNIDQTLFKDF